MAGKGSNRRPGDNEAYADNYEKIFGKQQETLEDLIYAYVKASLHIWASHSYDDTIILDRDRKVFILRLNTLGCRDIAEMAVELVRPTGKNVTEVTPEMLKLGKEAAKTAISYFNKKNKVYEDFPDFENY